jgi:hypothetical protein
MFTKVKNIAVLDYGGCKTDKLSLLINTYSRNSECIVFTDKPITNMIRTDYVCELNEEQIKKVNDVSNFKDKYTFIFKSTDLKMDVIRNQMYTVRDNVTNIFVFENGKIPDEVLSHVDIIVFIAYDRKFILEENFKKWLSDNLSHDRYDVKNIKNYLYQERPGNRYTVVRDDIIFNKKFIHQFTL